ncbi:hypothetical protein [Amycolatopsis sp. SID8362]|uniref:hypothetical protein n=1 Tax=Amycolatopsis sp. SID8362 TaxID=2690346 RepID=UPI00136B5BE5|nr:hypothetical protein [Amycolatopsis sp. SID8362]NBH10393.1 hypothetical protein [Amycolatopsis sp. SID8362]NED47088.1 hypothetical protein [Amycolatopsis sp. SID8362]
MASPLYTSTCSAASSTPVTGSPRRPSGRPTVPMASGAGLRIGLGLLHSRQSCWS